jgi:hypothetical protein
MRHWKDARTVADLGQLMADWLEGRTRNRPAYGDDRSDPETSKILRPLVALNRGGYLTDNSQPGYYGRGHDGRRWTQLPFVTGFVSGANRPLVDALQRDGRAAGLVVIINGQRDDGRPGGVPVTFAGREVVMHAGSATSGEQLHYEWSDDLRSAALTDLMCAFEVTLIDLGGKRRTRLWDVTTRVVARNGRVR